MVPCNFSDKDSFFVSTQVYLRVILKFQLSFTRLKPVNGKSVESDCFLRRNLPFWWNITLCQCSMFLVVTRSSWQHCCAIEHWRITTLEITNRGL